MKVRPCLKQKSVTDYIVTDAQLMKAAGYVHVESKSFVHVMCMLVGENNVL